MKSQLSILFLCTFPKRNRNGVERFSWEIINGIRSTGTRTYDLFWTKENGLFRSYIELLKNFLLTVRNVNVVHFVALTPYNIPFLILAKILKKKILITYHGNYLVEVSLINQPHIFIPFWIADRISRGFSDIIVSPTAYLIDEMKINQNNVHVIPLPFNLQLLHNSTKNIVKTCSTDIVFASASNFNIKEKVIWLNLLIEAMDKVTKHVQDVKLMIFGFGTYLDKFKTKYANNQNIVFMGFREDFRDFLNSVDGYIHISGLDNQPYAIIEALIQGKVIICNDLGGMIETIKPNTNYVVSLDLPSILQAIYTVIDEIKNNPIEFQEKGNINRKFAVNRYSSEVISAEYIKLYSKLLYDSK